MSAKRTRTPPTESSQESVIDLFGGLRFDSGSSAAPPLKRSKTPKSFNIALCIVQNEAGVTWCPQNTMFAYNKDNEQSVQAEMNNVKKFAAFCGDSVDFLYVEAFAQNPPTAVGGISQGFKTKRYDYAKNKQVKKASVAKSGGR